MPFRNHNERHRVPAFEVTRHPVLRVGVRGLLLFAIVLCHSRIARAEEVPVTGTIRGTVVYRADRARPWRFGRYYIKSSQAGLLAEAVVGLQARKLTRPNTSPRAVRVDQVNHQFTPETIAIRDGDSVRFANSDKELHSVKTSDPRNSFNITVAKGDEYTHTFRHVADFRPVVLGCAFHGAMRGWIYIFNHPYFAVTKANGEFVLHDVPPGTYTLRMVHPAGELVWRESVSVSAGETVSVSVEVSPDDRMK